MTLILNNPAKPHLKRWTKAEFNADVDPIADSSATLGFRYASLQAYGHDQVIMPLLRPDISVSVGSLVATE